jgi:hypothetical protein
MVVPVDALQCGELDLLHRLPWSLLVDQLGLVEPDRGLGHEAWVVAVLAGDLHMTAEEIAMLDAEYARQLVLDHWSRPTAP